MSNSIQQAEGNNERQHLVSENCGNEAESNSFDLVQLTMAVSNYFQEPCTLVKLAQGGYHKVYDVLSADLISKDAIVRVASPTFPKDKMESEVATLKYLKAFTAVLVPDVLYWNSDASNPVGADYMIMQKMEGSSPFDDWKMLPVEIKEIVVRQVAKYLVEMFFARFDKAGSLYCPSRTSSDLLKTSDFHVGPIVSDAFYTSLDGVNELYPYAPLQMNIEHQKLRGPFEHTSDFMTCTAKAYMLGASQLRDHVLKEFQCDPSEAEAQLARAQEILTKAIQLSEGYPGERLLHEPTGTPDKPFSFCLSDFRTTNVLINQKTGAIQSLIDFESTTIAPLWACAEVPSWIPDPDSDMRNWYGGTPADQRRLWNAFHETIAEVDTSGEWRRAYKNGEAYRLFLGRLELGLSCWIDLESFVNELEAWAGEHPGEPMPEKEF